MQENEIKQSTQERRGWKTTTAILIKMFNKKWLDHDQRESGLAKIEGFLVQEMGDFHQRCKHHLHGKTNAQIGNTDVSYGHTGKSKMLRRERERELKRGILVGFCLYRSNLCCRWVRRVLTLCGYPLWFFSWEVGYFNAFWVLLRQLELRERQRGNPCCVAGFFSYSRNHQVSL